MKIYNSSDELLLDITVDDNSYRNRQIMGDHNLTLYYSLPEHVEIPVGAYVDYQNVRYTLERPEALKMKHRRLFEYTVTFEAYQSCAKRWKFRNPVDGRLTFPLTAKPVEHLQMFVDNMNRRDSGWRVGSCIDAAEHLISYDHDFCIEALRRMADEFGTEYEINGKTVSLRKVEYNKSNPLPLAYGRGNGFKPNVGRSNSGDAMPVEILFTQGGSDNIDPSKYDGNKNLLLPLGQTIGYDGEHFSDEAGFNTANARWYVSSQDGLSIQRSDKALSSQAEDSLDCTDISPKRVGTVGQVVTVDAENHFYDFTDQNAATDPCPNYEDYLIEGEAMTVIFQSGMLAGRELEVKYIHEPKTVKGVAKLGRRFEIVPQDIDGITLPDAAFKPAEGDKYVVYHCSMPQSYICDNSSKSGASWEMFRTAVRYFFEHEEQLFSFTGELDGIWAKKDWENIGGRILLGGYVSFKDDSFQSDPVLVRITGIKDYINNPHAPEITLSNEVVTGGFSSEFKKVQTDEVLIEDTYTRSEQFTKRRFRDAQETMKMLEASLMEGFTGSISPVAAQMLQLLVGDESLQFRFVTSHTAANPAVVTPVFAFDGDTGIFSVTGGYYLQHITLGINTMKASHNVSEYKWWSVQSFTSAVLDDPNKKYYLYLKCPTEVGTACVFRLSDKAIKIDGESGYYHLLVGVLNSEYEGERSFASLYGFTEVTGGRITTDKIVSNDGNTYFDLAGSEIGGRIVFTNRSGQTITLLQLENALHKEAQDAQDAADAAQDDIDDANERLDKWASDSYISPEEKTALRQEKSDIEQEYIAVCADADRYEVVKTSYAAAYNKAVAALTKYTAATPENITIGTDYADIAAYYVARKTILQAIATAAKTYAETYADGKVSGAKEALEKAILDGDKAAYAAAVADIEAFGKTIISGGYIKTDLINVDELVVKNVYSKDGKFQLLADGSMKAVNGEFSGTVNADKGILNNVTVQGSMSSPIVLWRTKDIKVSGSSYVYTRYPYGDASSSAQHRYCFANFYKSGNYIYTRTIFCNTENPSVGTPYWSYSTVTEQLGTVTEVATVNVIDGNADGSGRHDNVILPQLGGTGTPQVITAEQFSWDASNIGRCVRLLNYKYASEPDGYIKLEAPSGKYFYECGYQTTSIRLSREYVELYGYGADGVFYGWIVVNRQDIKTRGEYGMPWKVIYQGCVNPYASVQIERLWDVNLDIQGEGSVDYGYQKLGTGRYKITLPKLLSKYNPSTGITMFEKCWHVIIVPRSCLVDGTSPSQDHITCGYACLAAKGHESGKSYFIVETADDASKNDLGFDFYVISMANWIDPTVNH